MFLTDVPALKPEMLLTDVLALVPEGTPSPMLMKIKPMQVREFRKWYGTILKHMLRSGKDFTTIVAGVKADGHSVVFECHDGGQFKIYARTDTHSPLLWGDDARRFVTQLACKARAHLMCELRALYDGQELGFLEVLAMLKQFRDNGMQNSGKLQLQLCPFGIYSVNPEGGPDSARAGTFLPLKAQETLLNAFVEPGGGLVSPVEGTKYRVRLFDSGKGRQDLEFLSADGRQTFARGEQEFFDKLIAQADERGIEGFVLSADPTIFEKEPAVIDMFGVRDQSKVKVKREYKVTLMACRILQNTARGKKHMIYAYGLAPDGGIVYAGEHTKNQRLHEMLPPTMHAFTFRNKDEKIALYRLTEEQYRQRRHHFRAFTVSCTNMSKDRFCPIGLKLHDMVFKPVDLAALSVLQRVAEANPHFLATKAASNKFAEAIHRHEKRRDHQKRKHKSQASLQVHRKAKAQQYMAELGEEFKPPQPVEREASPDVVDDLPAVDEPEPAVDEPEPVMDDQPVMDDRQHTVLFAQQIGPTQADMQRHRLKTLGWSLALNPGPSVTLIVANQKQIDRMPGMCICTDLKEKCPDAKFITPEALKARLEA